MKANGVAAACLVASLWAAAGEDIEKKTVEEAYGPPRAASHEAPATGMLRPLGVTLVLLGVAGGLVVVLRRFGAKRPLFGGRALSVLETAYLSPKHSIALVRIRNRVLVVGMGQDLRTLAVFDQPDEVLEFDGEFRRELASALDGDAPAEKSAALDPYRRQIRTLRQAVGRWRERLRGEEQS